MTFNDRCLMSQAQGHLRRLSNKADDPKVAKLLRSEATRMRRLLTYAEGLTIGVKET